MSKTEVSIIIVSYKKRKALMDCLSSIYKHKIKHTFEVIIVDNENSSSLKKLVKKTFPKTKYVGSKNIGYGKGNNKGSAVSKGKYLFFLNPDTQLHKASVDILASALDKNTKLAAVAPQLVDKEGQNMLQVGQKILTPVRGIFALTFLNRLFPKNPISQNYFNKEDGLAGDQNAEVLPGSAFMIRKSVFNEVGKFDENMFLFFEEADLGKRLIDKKYKMKFITKARVVHFWDPYKKSNRVKNAFKESRFYYFKKHYGTLWALTINLFASVSKIHLLIATALVLAALLRLYRLPENLVFHSELGHNYLAMKEIVEKRQIPLLGPPTSHPWLYFGPLFYWLFAPIFYFSGYNPVTIAYIFAMVGIVVVLFNFVFARKLFGSTIALYSTFLLAQSPLFIRLTRESRFFSLVAVVWYPFIYFLFKALSDPKVSMFIAGLLFGVLLNFHLTPLIFLPFIFWELIKQKVDFKKRALQFMGGGLIPTLPFLLYSFTSDIKMFGNAFVWIPYRIGGFLGLIEKNNFTSTAFAGSMSAVVNFIQESFVAISSPFSIGILLLLLFSLQLILTKSFKEEININLRLLSWLFIFGILAIFIHGEPPVHYFLPLFPIPILVFSALLSFISRYNAGLAISWIFIAAITLFNCFYFFSERWFYISQDKITNGLVPYTVQKEVTNNIVVNTEGRTFNIERIGIYDEFEGNFADNYRFLLWKMGNEPQKDSENVYIISEEHNEGHNYIYNNNGIYVWKVNNGN